MTSSSALKKSSIPPVPRATKQLKPSGSLLPQQRRILRSTLLCLEIKTSRKTWFPRTSSHFTSCCICYRSFSLSLTTTASLEKTPRTRSRSKRSSKRRRKLEAGEQTNRMSLPSLRSRQRKRRSLANCRCNLKVPLSPIIHRRLRPLKRPKKQRSESRSALGPRGI